MPYGSQVGDASIEVLRGLAACMVMLAHYMYMVIPHAGLWGFASTGVDLFFVLSGYVFGPYLYGRSVPLAPHFIRRFFRIFPLYWLALGLYGGLRWWQGQPTPHISAHILMLHTTESIEVASTYNVVFWSLPPELEFYLALPVLAWLASRSTFWYVLLAAFATKLALVVVRDVPGGPLTAWAFATIHLPGLLCEFMLGAWAWYLAKTASSTTQRSLRLVAGFSVLAVSLVLYGVHVADFGSNTPHPPQWLAGSMGLWSAVGYALFVSAVVGRPAGRSTSHFARAGIWLGHCSYGIYLVHNAAPQLLSAAGVHSSGWVLLFTCVIITVAVSWGLHLFVERPMRNWGRALAHRAL